jgi:hypothetical protein
MTAGGRTFTAVYKSLFINAYVDYGNGALDSEGRTYYEVHTGCEAYGNNVWRDGAEDNKPGIAHKIVNVTSWDEGNMPGANYLPVGWDIFYLDENANLYDENTWKSGVNENEGDGTAKYDLVFRANWKAYNEFFFRINDTSYQAYCALGKNFKLYYFNNGRSVAKEDAVLNKTESSIILLFTPVLENFSWDGFFKKEMWDMVSLKFDPVFVPKSMFTVEGMTGLFRAAIDAIGNLIKEA